MEESYNDPEGEFRLPLMFNWALPPLEDPPDLVVLAAKLAGVGGFDLPIEVSGVESTGALSTTSDLRLSLVGKAEVSLVDVMLGQEKMCDTLDRCREVSEWLIDQATDWKIRYPET